MLLRLAYQLIWLLALPLVLLRLGWRARRQPDYLAHIPERFAHYRAKPEGSLIWIHAVSVGETRAAEPLVKALLAGNPDCAVLLTHMTPTGRETAAALFGSEPRVTSVYLPYDLATLTRRFLAFFRPRLGIVMETELWPSLLLSCRAQGVPVLLANARLSQRSAARYAHWPTLTRMTLGALSAIGAQSADDASRLRALGAQKVEITGNIKFDIPAPEGARELGRRFRDRCQGRPVVLAASTREGEESSIVEAFARLAPAQALLVLVPRHPQRFEEVAGLVRSRGLTLQRRSDETAVEASTRVWLGDSMGEMFAYYLAADVALIGGSWLPLGGQNLIEACAVGTPVIIGPHTFNFQQVAEQAEACGAAIRAHDIEDGMQRAIALLNDEPRRVAVSSAGLDFAFSHRGATDRTMQMIDRLLEDRC